MEYDLPAMFNAFFLVAVLGFAVFSIVVMIAVYQAAISAKQYFDRENLKAWQESIPKQKARTP